eukprot:COSAG01_NODE_8870_length_2631_cov_3.138231_5_plen_161_part_00
MGLVRGLVKSGRRCVSAPSKTHGRLEFTHTVANHGRWSQLTKCEALQPLHIRVSALPCLVSVVQLSQNTPPHLRQWWRRSVSPKSPDQHRAAMSCCIGVQHLVHDCNIIEAPWLVNGGHGASLRHHNDVRLHTRAPCTPGRAPAAAGGQRHSRAQSGQNG